MKLSKAKALGLGTLMAAVMLFGGLGVNAETAQGPTLEKTVKIEKGTTVQADYGAVEFEIAQIANADGVAAPETIATYTQTIDFTGATSETGTIVKTDDLVPAVKKTGEYTFKVTEKTPKAGADGSGMFADDADQEFILHVYVDKDGNKTYALTATNEADDATKLDKAEFSNTYRAFSTLTVSKTVQNPEYVDADTEFEMTITFTKAATTPDDETIADPVNAGQTIAYGTPYTFKLKDGDKVKFENLPTGTTYTLSEAGFFNKDTTEYVLTENGNEQTLDAVSDALISEGTNSVEVQNTAKSIVPTGLIVTMGPWIAMIALAGAAVAAYLFAKKRVRADR